jgi:D-methionine transport system substrate-binding protein
MFALKSLVRKLAAAALIAAVFGLSTAANAEPALKVATNPGPVGEVVEVIAKLARARGLPVDVIELSDWVQPNAAVDSGEADVNFFEHIPFLKAAIKAQGYRLTPIASVLVMPVGLFSHKVKSLQDVDQGATIAIANDPVNGARGLRLFQKAGLLKLKLKLKPGAGDDATIADIVENPRRLRIVELEAAQLVRALDDVAMAQVSFTYLLATGGDPKAALVTDGENDQHYAIQFVVRTGREADPRIQNWVEVARSPEVRAFIEKKYGGVIVPAW